MQARLQPCMLLSAIGPRTKKGRLALLVVLSLVFHVTVSPWNPESWVSQGQQTLASTWSEPKRPPGWEPDYVTCFDDVKASFAFPSNQSVEDFCNAPCVEELLHYMVATGMNLSKIAIMEEAVPTPRDGAEDDPSNQNPRNRGRIIVNSIGGVASTFLVEMLRVHLGYELNSDADKDGLKHGSPTRLFSEWPFRRNEEGQISFHERNNKWEKTKRRGQLVGVIYIMGDPVHAIFSHFTRGWPYQQFRKLNYGRTPGTPELANRDWWNSTEIFFRTSAALGEDAFGIGNHARQWMDLQDHLHFGLGNPAKVRTTEMKDLFNSSYYEEGVAPEFPPLFITDYATVREAPGLIAELLNVNASRIKDLLELPALATTDASKKKTPAEEAGIVSEAGATEIYRKLTHEFQRRIKQNYLVYAIKFRCGF